MTSYSTLIETIRLSCTIFKLPFSSYGAFFVESDEFYPTPPAFVAPIGVIPFEFLGELWRQKTRVTALSCDIICVILCLVVLIQ